MSRASSWDERYMRLALTLAREASRRGDVPVGAVVVVEGRLVGWGHNRREAQGQLAGHAELDALRVATGQLGGWRLGSRSTLYVTLEPCAMCAGALSQARVERIVFGCRDAKAGALRSVYAMAEDPRLPWRSQVTEGVLAGECGSLLSEFFEQLRRR